MSILFIFWRRCAKRMEPVLSWNLTAITGLHFEEKLIANIMLLVMVRRNKYVQPPQENICGLLFS